MRIIDNELFYDWPWGWGEYQNGGGPNEEMIEIIFSVISRISDIGNSVFIFGEEIGFLPWYIPMPAFSCAPKLSSSEMPWVSSRSILFIYYYYHFNSHFYII